MLPAIVAARGTTGHASRAIIFARFEPRVLGMGYNIIGDIIAGKLATGDLIQLSVGKSVALWVALGSGTSGGLLAPMLMIGAAVGSIFGTVVHAVAPQASFNAHVAAVVAMSALFGAAARAPFTAFVFAFELTRNPAAIVPLMIGGATADVACRFFLRESIMTERLARRGLHVAQDLEVDPLQRVNVATAMTRNADALAAATPIGQVIAAIDGHRQGYWHQGYPVLDDQGRLFGVVTRSDLASATSAIADADDESVSLNDPVSMIASTDLSVTYPDVSLADALQAMVRRGVGRLPVVERSDARLLAGWLSRSDIFRAREQAIHGEFVRERLIKPAKPAWRGRRGAGNGSLASATKASIQVSSNATASAQQQEPSGTPGECGSL